MKIFALIFLVSFQSIFSQTGHWDSIPTKGNPGFRYDHGMAPIGDKQVLVFGGAWDRVMNDTWLFDLKDSSWTKIETIHTPSAREACEMVQISKNSVMMHGGMDDDWRMKNDTWIFSLDSMDWRQVITDSIGPAITRFGMARYNDSLVFLTEGGTTLGWGAIWYFNIIKEEWHRQFLKYIPEQKTEPNVIQIDENAVLVCGGTNHINDYLEGLYVWANDKLIQNRKRVKAGFSTDIEKIQKDFCLIWSGTNISGQRSPDTWIYNYNKDEWILMDTKKHPIPRLRHKLARIDSNIVLMYGGGTELIILPDTWIFSLDSETGAEEGRGEEGINSYYNSLGIVIEHKFEDSGIKAEAFDKFGKKVGDYYTEYLAGKIIISNANLARGCYFVRVRANGKVYFSKAFAE